VSAEWKAPDGFIQLVTVGGWVFDVSFAQSEMIRNELTHQSTPFMQFEDIYGAECWVRGSTVVGFRAATQESADNYRIAHANEDEGESWA
jgi:hypothetical protein